MNLELPYHQSNCNRNTASKYLLKVGHGGNVVKFRVVNKDITIMLLVVLTAGNVTTCFDVSVVALSR